MCFVWSRNLINDSSASAYLCSLSRGFDAGEDKGDDKDESDGTKSRIRAHCKFRNISIWKPHTLLSFTQ